ncbi:hypothetical protein CsatB_027774 [Cannabis sativa]
MAAELVCRKSARDKTQDTSLGFLNSKDGDEHWQTPNAETIKVNTDVAIFEQSQWVKVSVRSSWQWGRGG